ncbi:hypothetical protein EVA_14866 [gut metagenome]|uniref:Uncharacterized protein n=1 Tax=gut metagenome TaxID=749906 RepID=J9FQ22_9ZZZZ
MSCEILALHHQTIPYQHRQAPDLQCCRGNQRNPQPSHTPVRLAVSRQKKAYL